MSQHPDTLLHRAATSYNLPAATPREAIWADIQRARAGASDRRHRGAASVKWLRWCSGLAAAVIVAFGVGRLVFIGNPEPATFALRTPIVVTPPRDVSRNPAPLAIPSAGAVEHDARPGAAEPRREERSAPEDAPPRDAGSVPGSESYAEFAAAEYVNQVELFLSLFRADADAGRVDGRAAARARELLSATRLLLDTARRGQPALGNLLVDLELVLAQIAQLPESGGATEVRLITQGMERHGVLSRLRIAAAPRTLLAAN